jgi:hypothetical protein
MNTRDADTADAPPADAASLWKLIPATEYRLPEAPAASAARARWTALRRLFGGNADAAEQPARAEADLRRPPAGRLDALVAPLCWDAGAAALDDVLAGRDDAESVSFLVGPPHSGHAELVRRWAEQRGVLIIDTPEAGAILSGGRDWLDVWPTRQMARGHSEAAAEHPVLWALPRLEHCWLRHAAGLGLVRELLMRALDGRLGRGIIACDSWAWAFLRHVAALPSRTPWTLRDFDGERLAMLLRDLVVSDGSGPLQFRHAQTGKVLLALDDDDQAASGNLLQSLAARCRGNAGLARAQWRALLRAEPDQGADTEASADDGTTIWVAPATDLSAIFSESDEALALLLHSLLLHDGLPDEQLAALLPLRWFRVQAMLWRLAAAGALSKHGCGRWRITAAAYPEARALLRAQGFLLDDF